MLVNMRNLLSDAQKGNYAVGSFSVANMEMEKVRGNTPLSLLRRSRRGAYGVAMHDFSEQKGPLGDLRRKRYGQFDCQFFLFFI